ncbi:antibiotic biosynthesis monooxygenase [Sphingomonas aracearum]|uniref:Antibiotic biosynthesis monooxygenase n=2 Tax=Sphingomonas aracearum TaxID=2283317 RepID=A0A369VUN6_9SPHN|nr:antibiotic biosynthesis monooxygenase [Sphingomonas aracearum]
MVGRIRALPGRRAALIAILAEGTGAMPGCLSYVVAEDLADPDAILVTEIWRTREAHAASLQLPAVRDAIVRGRPLIASFEPLAETRPVAGVR